MERELENAPNLCEKFIRSALNIPPDIGVQIIHHGRNAVNFNIIEETNDGRVLFKIKIHHDYGYILDWLRSNEELQEKINKALKKVGKKGKIQTLVFNFPA